jgi:transmembrane sensor
MDEDDKAAGQRREEAAQWFARLKTVPCPRERSGISSRGGAKHAMRKPSRKQNASGPKLKSLGTPLDPEGSRGRALAPRRIAEPAPCSDGRNGCNPYRLLRGGISPFFRAPARHPTDTGELRLVALDDGSRVQLNTQTRIKVHFHDNSRQLVLQNGEALFRVAHDASRPFTVVAGAVTVTATGTQFDVSRNDDRIAVTLMQGQVIVRAADGTATTLLPGQQWRWPLEGAAVRNVNTANVVAWMQGRIVFDDTALADAIATVNRYGGKPVMLDTPGMAQERISGTFEAGDSQSFATAVTAFLPLQLRKDGEGNIHLAAAK